MKVFKDRLFAYSQNNLLKWAHDLNKAVNAVKNKAAWWKPTAYLGRVTGKQVSEQFEKVLNQARQDQKWLKNPADFKIITFVTSIEILALSKHKLTSIC